MTSRKLLTWTVGLSVLTVLAAAGPTLLAGNHRASGHGRKGDDSKACAASKEKGHQCKGENCKVCAAARSDHEHHAARHAALLKSAMTKIAEAREAVESGEKDAALKALAAAESTLKELHSKAVAESRPAIVNNRCPIMGNKIDPEEVPAKLYRRFNGKGVGFCCAGCPSAWDKLSDEKKAEKLADATPESSAKSDDADDKQEFANARCPIMGSKIDPDNVPDRLTRTFEGKKVAFCCGGCPAAWDKLSDEQKAAKLKTASGRK
jgi:ribosomal protein S20